MSRLMTEMVGGDKHQSEQDAESPSQASRSRE